MIFVGIIIALVLFGDVPEPSNFTDIYETNKCQRLRDSVDWTYLRIWVLLGPWDIDERQSALFRVLRSYRIDPFSPR